MKKEIGKVTTLQSFGYIIILFFGKIYYIYYFYNIFKKIFILNFKNI